jgi:thiamine-phosphate pyrophosphorylase
VTRAGRASLLHGLYVIVNDAPEATAVARVALGAGVRVLQYRAKSGIDGECLRRLRALTHERDALLIVNDDWRAALAFSCDGVHLGSGDDGFADVAPVRAALPEAIIGLSCATEDEMRAAHRAGVDYAGVGAVYATASKDDAGDPIGIAGLRRVAGAAPVPVAAIGGITRERVADIKRAGVAMAAVISALARAADVEREARALVRAWGAA